MVFTPEVPVNIGGKQVDGYTLLAQLVAANFAMTPEQAVATPPNPLHLNGQAAEIQSQQQTFDDLRKSGISASPFRM
jgi:hypothetical protein